MAASLSRVRKGAWTEEEDNLLRKCIEKYGERHWHQVPLRAGLNRCRKSCRLRWVNYLRPDIKKGEFEEDEVDLILRLQKLLGNRWSLIARRLPGRTANGIKNYWNTYLRKRPICSADYVKEKGEKPQSVIIIRPRPRILSKSSLSSLKGTASTPENSVQLKENLRKEPSTSTTVDLQENETAWWESLLAGADLCDEGACGSMGCLDEEATAKANLLVENSPPWTTKVEDNNLSGVGQSYSCDFSVDINLWNLFD